MVMIMNKLEVGQVFKNYKAVCEWLEVPPTEGNSRKAHVKEFGRYCEYHKDGQKFIIDEVFEKPTDKPKKISNGNSKYYDDIEITLLYLLQKEKKRTLIFSVGKTLEIMNMINQNYRIVKNNIDESSEILNIPKEHLNLFFNTYHSPLINIFENNLRTMRGKSLIFYNKHRMVVKLKALPKLNELGEIMLDERGKANIKTQEIHTLQTDEESELIDMCEANVRNEMGYENKTGIFLSGRWTEFSSEVNKRLYKIGNIKYYYDVYKIVCNMDGIDKVIKKYQYKNCKSNLNDSVINKIKVSIDKKYQTNKVEEVYVTDSNKLIDTVINDNCSIDMKQRLIDKKVEHDRTQDNNPL